MPILFWNKKILEGELIEVIRYFTVNNASITCLKHYESRLVDGYIYGKNFAKFYYLSSF